jgi:preprotein translocase subunit SecE
MGKVKDGISVSTQSKASKGKPGGSPRSLFLSFLVNLIRVDLFKPMQGWYARVYTAVALGVVVATGAWRISESTLEYAPLLRFGLPAAFAAVLGWVVFRIVHFPPFAEFLIATEAEMNKVSWTNRKRLVQDTIVVLVTVFLFTMFLFVVDIIWIKVLSNQYIQVLLYDPREKQQQQQETAKW